MSGKYALIIGNTEYTDPGLAQLTAPGKDAEDFARVLNDKEICAFDEAITLLNQPEHIIRRSIDVFFDQKKPDDLLILYFSGHGIRDEFGTLYLAVKNTDRFRLRSTAIKSDFIRDAMDQSRSRRQVLILDCCNSGAFAQGTKAAIGVSIGIATAFESGYGRIILTASDSTQFAWEGDKVIGEIENSLFTHFLVEGLKGKADLNSDGYITVDELYDYAYEKVRLATSKQTPSKFSIKQQGEIVLRQNIQINDTKSIFLPVDLIDATKSSVVYVREGAVRKLYELLRDRNPDIAHSARLVLEKIALEDSTRYISELAKQVLERVRQAEQLVTQREVAEIKQITMSKTEHQELQRTENMLRSSTKGEVRQLIAEATDSSTSLPTVGLEDSRIKSQKQITKTLGLAFFTLLCFIMGYYLFGTYIPTQISAARATNTVIAKLTSTMAAKSTNTALAESTSTAIAKSTNTAIAVAIVNNFISTAEAEKQLMFGPEDDSLKHVVDDYVSTSYSGVQLKNFVVKVTFQNPFSPTTGTWDYGIGFRQEEDREYRLVINSDKYWELENWTDSKKLSTIAGGQLTDFDTNSGGSNTILLYCEYHKGILYVNGNYIAELDLTTNQKSGNIWIGTGLINGDEINGYSTDYKDFTVWEIP